MTEEGKTTTTLGDRLSGISIEEERVRTAEAYSSLTEREKQAQGSVWALIFLISELAAANRIMRNVLVEKEVWTPEEDEAINKAIVNPQNLSFIYNNTEKAFYEKYNRVRFAMENPEEVEKIIEEARKAEGEDKVDGETTETVEVKENTDA